MSHVISAVRWNVGVAPIQFLVGVAQTAAVARLLGGQDVSLLGRYALVAAIATSIPVWAGMGMQPLFSRIFSRHIEARHFGSAGAQYCVTLAMRVCIGLLAVCVAMLVAFALHVVPHKWASGSGVELWFAIGCWAIAYDAASLGQRALYAMYQHRSANLIALAGHASWVAIIVFAAVTGRPAWRAALLAPACCYGLQIIAQTICLRQLIVAGRGHAGMAVQEWLEQLRPAALVAGDKLIAHALSAQFGILLLSTVASKETLGILYVITDFAGKVVAVAAVPASGVLIPLFSRLATRSEAAVGCAYLLTHRVVELVGVAAFLAAGILTVPALGLIYGVSITHVAAAATAVTVIGCAEYLIAEPTLAVLLGLGNLSAVLRSRVTAVGATLVAITALWIAGASVFVSVVALYGIRLGVALYLAGKCAGFLRVPRPSWSALSYAASGGILLSHFMYGAGLLPDTFSVGLKGAIASTLGLVGLVFFRNSFTQLSRDVRAASTASA